MKPMTLAIIVLFAVSLAYGKTCTWTGGGDGVSFENASNWDNGVPAAGDTAVFSPQGNLFVSLSANMTGNFGELRFESGNTVFGLAPGVTKGNINFATSSVLHVAENATATITNRVAGAANGTQMTISGGGEIVFNSDNVDNVGFFSLIDITDGTSVTYFRSGGAEWRPLLTRIRTGSSLLFKGKVTFPKAQYGHESYSSFQVDAGGTLEFNVSNTPNMGSVRGEGTLRIGGANSLTFGLYSGSATFSGNTEYYSVNNVAGSLTVTFNPADPSYTYTLASENAFAGVNVVDSQYGTLRFSTPGAAYSLGSYRSPNASGFTLEDSSGGSIAVYGGWQSNALDTVSILPCRTGTKLGGVGGSFSLSSSSLWQDGTGASGGPPDIYVSAGGTLVQCAANSTRTSATQADPAIFSFDGGTYLASVLGVPGGNTFAPFGIVSQSNVVVRVGAGGVRMGVCDEGTAMERTIQINTFIEPSASPDGGLTRDACWGKFVFRRHLSLAGPFRSLDGTVQVFPVVNSELAEYPSWFGTGDIAFRNSILYISSIPADALLSLASGAGSAFRYDKVAAIQFSYDATAAANAKRVAIGPAGAAKDSALVRGGKGSVLYLWDHIAYGSGLFDGTRSSLTVNGGISTNASGTVRQPIVIYSPLENRIHFATCLEDGSIRAFMGYKTTLDGATSTDIVSLSSSAAVPKNTEAYVGGLKLSGSSASLSLNPGATLHVGNGVDPAVVIVDKPHISGTGDGAIDFGASEGVFAGVHESTVIGPVLKGSGGITFVSPPKLTGNAGYRYVRLANSNLHGGGTYISSVRLSPENAGAFGVGDVYVGGGHEWGGRIHFNTEGLVFANNFHVAGWGKVDTESGDHGTSGYGALTFTATTEISGNVELEEPTRICCLNAGAVATFSGTVSGDALQVYNGAGIVLLTRANTYTGGTEIVASTLKISGDGSLGTGDVLLDGGTLVIDKNTAFSLENRICGKGTVRLEGKGVVDFAGGLEIDDYGGLVTENFTLALGSRNWYEVSSLNGFSRIVVDGEAPVDLYVADGGSFTGPLPANVTIHAGSRGVPGSCIIVF